MAYDHALAERIRRTLKGTRRLSEKGMFGGVGFLVAGNMACGVAGDEMMVRVGPEGHATAIQQPHTRAFDLTGKPTKGWILVRPAGLKSDAALRRWVDRGVAFARSLPPK